MLIRSGQGIAVGWADFARTLLRNRRLIFQLARREVLGRYRGSLIGLAWSFITPLLMLAIYTFVFSTVFQARWGSGEEERRIDFAIVLFLGLIVHGIFAECINRAPQLIISNASYVKKVVFPLEIMPWVAMSSALFHAAACLLVLLAAQLLASGTLPWTWLLLPLVLAPLVLATMGIAWLLAALGVYVRDISQATSLVTSVLLFLSPVFYPVAALPASFRPYLLLNPLTFIIEQAREVAIWGRLPDWTGLLVYSLISLLLAWLGFWVFQKMRRGFADVL